MGQAFSGVMRGSHLLLAGIMLAVMPVMVEAVGLGRLKVKSALNEPLNAEIPLTSVTRREIRSLEAALAPRGAFEALGIERPGHLSQIKFNVAKRLDGTYFLQLTTRSPYQEPFLHMLVQVEWAGGRLRREYTALIDPPYLSSARPSSITAPRLQAPAADYEPLPEPLADEVLKESVAPTKVEPEKKLPEPIESLPEPLPEEPKLINKQDDAPQASAATVETAPALPEPIQDEGSAGKSIDQIEAEAFGGGMGAPAAAEPEVVATAPVEPLPEPVVEAYDRGEGLLGPPHIPIIPVEPAVSEPPMQQMARMEPSFWAASDQYKVKRGDTLYEIAERLRKDSSLSLNQVMMAIYDANPRAFYDNNVNNLRAGRILQVPEVEVVRGRSATVATRQFRTHYDAWQEHRIKLAQAKTPVRVAESTPKPAPAPAAKKADDRQAKLKAKREADAKAKAKAQADAKAKKQAAAKAQKDARDRQAAKAKAEADAKAKKQAAAKKAQQAKKPASAPKPKPSKTAKAKQTEDLLRIVRASMLVAPGDGAQTAETESRQAEKERQLLAKRMNNLEESAESAKLQNKEISDKVGKVQKNIENQKRLIDVENPSLAKGQPAKPAAKPAVKPAAKPAVKNPAAKKPLQVAKAKKPAKPRPAPKPQPKEASILDTVMSIVLGNQFMLMLAGGVVLLGIAIFAIYMKRRRKTLADFEESILSADTTTDDLSTDSQEDVGESGDTSFLSDFSQEGMGNIATDEVDPIAEADVYLAYGRDEQAEEILKDAISKHPDRPEVKLKLLEIYHQRNDVSGFETLAEELYASGNAGSVWSQVSEMGTQLNPDNPMFQGEPPSAGMMGGGAEPAAGGGELDMTELVPGDNVMDDGSGMDDSLDFDIDAPASGGDATEIVSPPAGDGEISMDLSMDSGDAGGGDAGMDLDFNMDMDIGGGDEESAAAPAEEDSGGGEDFALDFNMDTADVGGEEEPSADIEAPASAEDEAGLDFSMDFEDSGTDTGSGEEISFESEDDGLSFDMEEGDSGLSMETSGDEGESVSLDMSADEGDGLSFDEGSDSDLDLSAMEIDEEADDEGLSALDMVKAEGGGLPENEDGSLDFSLNAGADDSAGEDFGLGGDDSDLDLSADFGGGETEVAEAVDVAEAVGNADVEVDGDENWDEAATKLDLAKAYIDMGDADGAKSILDEVMSEGNDEQKAQASELAAQI